MANVGTVVSRGTTVPVRPRRHVLLTVLAVGCPLIVLPIGTQLAIGAADITFPIALLLVVHRLASGRWEGSTAARTWFLLFVAVSVLITFTFLITHVVSDEETVQVLLLIRCFAVLLPWAVAMTEPDLAPDEIWRLVNILLTACSIALAVDLVLWQLQVSVPWATGEQRLWDATGASSLRAGGLTGNSGDTGHLAGITSTLALVVLLSGRGRLLPVVGLGLSILMIFASSSRGALLHLVVFVALVLVAHVSRKPLAALLLAVSAVLVGWLATPLMQAWVDADPNAARFDILNLTGQSQALSDAARFSTWAEAIQAFWASGFLGNGYNLSAARLAAPIDNSFVTIILDLGLLGGLVWIGYWASLVTDTLQVKGHIRVLVLAFVVSEVAQMLTVNAYKQWGSFPIFMLAVGLLVRAQLTASQKPTLTRDDADVAPVAPARRQMLQTAVQLAPQSTDVS